MGLVDCQQQSDAPTGDDRARWEEVKKAMESVWPRPNRYREPDLGFETMHPIHYSPQSSNGWGVMPNMRSTQQSSTTALSHPYSGIAHGATSIGMLLSEDANMNINMMSHFHPQPNPEAGQTLHPNASSAAIAGFGHTGALTTPPSMRFQESVQPSFSNAALDYDTILDDMASIEQTNLPESESQFMANLGLRPGTNLADVFSHEFLGFS
jgi:hypothetical protein